MWDFPHLRYTTYCLDGSQPLHSQKITSYCRNDYGLYVKLLLVVVMSEECLAASTFMFLVAGTEVSNALGLLLYNLSTNPEVQARLQTEVDEVVSKHGGYNYQAVKDMEYMDQVIQGTVSLISHYRECRITTPTSTPHPP